MGGLVAHRGAKSFDHAAGAHQEGKGMEVMLAVKTHGQVARQIDPQGHIMPLAGGGVALGQLVQDFPLGNDSEEVGFTDFADSIDIIELAPTKGFEHPRIVALKQHRRGCRQPRLTHLKAPRDATPGSDPVGPGCGCKVPIFHSGPGAIEHTPYFSCGSRRPVRAAGNACGDAPAHSR